MTGVLVENAGALFALLGALSGALIAGSFVFLLLRGRHSFRIREIIFERKLDVFNNFTDVVNVIRSMSSTGGDSSLKEIRRYPLIMQSRGNMDDFHMEFTRIKTRVDRWLSAGVRREL
jgi:hypothetical protein